MKCKWLLDQHMLDSSYHEDLTKVLDDLGYEYQIIKYIPHSMEAKVQPHVKAPSFKNEDCVVSYGSIEHLNSLSYYKNGYYPLYYMNKETLSCKDYLSRIPSKYLLNANFIMLPYGSFKDRKEQVFDLFNTNKLFIRPDSGLKTFAGTTIHYLDFDYEINTLEKLTGVLDNTLILISNIQPISKEYRILVGDGKVIASSMYKQNDKVVMKEGAPDGAKELAHIIANQEHQPDKAYTVDVAELENGDFKVIELNSFSCAGLYACNLYDVVKGISEIAEKDYKDYIGEY